MPRYRHKVQIQRDEPIQDSTGQPVVNWVLFSEPWANVEDMSRASQTDEVQKVTANKAVNVTMRYPRQDEMPLANWRVVYQEGDVTRTLNIEGIHRADQVRRVLVLECTEVQDG